MPPKRKNATSGRTKWTEEIMADLLSCWKRDIAEHQSGQNYQKKGYMKITRLLWEEKGYASLGLRAQNLRDKAAQLIKNEERSRQQYTNANEEVNMNEEANNAVEMPTIGAQERNQQENQQESQQESVGHENCINEEANNANHTSSVEHTICSYRYVPISISYASTETEQLHQQDINNIESEGYPREP